MHGYTPGEQPQRPGFVKLNTNENPYPPSPLVIDAICRAANERLRLYPDPLATSFREAASQVLHIPADWILPTNGSDEALSILVRACLGENDLLVAPNPSYPMYRVLAQLQNCRFEERRFTAGWNLPVAFCQGARLGIVPNPNSPTGTMVPSTALLEQARAADGLLVVDEAYVDFAQENCARFVRQCGKLVVTRTMSKSYSLAGIRFGFVLAQPNVIQTLRKVKEPYNCDALSIAAATAAITDQAYLQQIRQRIIDTRTRLEAALIDLGFEVTPSQTNFVWVRRQSDSHSIYEALKERKILVRHFRFDGFGDGLRISIGTDEDIDRLIEALRALA